MGERDTFDDFGVLAAFWPTDLGVAGGAGLIVRKERRLEIGLEGGFVGELAAAEGVLGEAGDASRRRFGGLGEVMDGDGVGSCFGAGEPLSDVCCCCCARDDLRYSVLGSGLASVSGAMIFPSE
jgi:hypothetical protein